MSTIQGETRAFCCPGCRQVFLALFNSPGGFPENFRETDLYRACVEAGVIPRAEAEPVPSPDEAASFPPLDLVFRIDGMWCPSCSWLIEEVLKKTRGVLEPQVLFISDLVRLKYFPH
ncbi:MAG TPA: hypothetical protein VLS90_05840, partial [Thermodesulfobacteriota bacterium]|nr:hypothetical protein [Thermodesulfobacteriota bacterium]